MIADRVADPGIAELVVVAELAPFDLDVMARTPYDPTDYQKVLFVAPSFSAMVRQLEDWLAGAGHRPGPRRR